LLKTRSTGTFNAFEAPNFERQHLLPAFCFSSLLNTIKNGTFNRIYTGRPDAKNLLVEFCLLSDIFAAALCKRLQTGLYRRKNMPVLISYGPQPQAEDEDCLPDKACGTIGRP